VAYNGPGPWLIGAGNTRNNIDLETGYPP